MVTAVIQGRQIQVLLVEDDYITSSAFKIMINSMNMHVVKSVSSGEASIIASAEIKPDLIVMDIILEGKITGIEAARIINQNLSIPIIFLTGSRLYPSKTSNKDNYPFEIIQKPLTSENDFLKVVKKILRDIPVFSNETDLFHISST
ncbi:Protein-glutamate methylesterase/protein-glutamine glutaminase [Candidatus Lokiarchaeum ossiferum]|uniref:Protein-glutamate methylesterase/protein-glutamine glutaminase n=1 Tax=Candidatus Lokiarchaeum ossiferum TaxID=2951803 RepID=A0ABY6HY73_9ARCH|nr:Protein-glutamate methylesterase/protein-glutamine glutaminase [Candidatus Lokiarchaeum sp. B-35]